MKKRLSQLFALAALCCAVHVQGQTQFTPNEWDIPANGNSYVTHTSEPRGQFPYVGRMGFVLKEDAEGVVSSYVYLPEACRPTLALLANGHGQLQVTCGKKTFKLNIDSDTEQRIKVGRLAACDAGHIRIDFQIKNAGEKDFVIVKDLILSDMDKAPLFIDKNYSPYFGRRGPSCHLQYNFEGAKNVAYTYNEITVPEDGFIPNTYYCAQGFDGGYFGFQRVSEDKTVVIFSVWNAVDDDNPKNVEEKYRAKIIKSGEQARLNDFGNEGSGKQVMLDYNWKPGNTYRFLLHAEHASADETDYSAYFYAADEDRWIYIATLRRPKTTYLISGLYSFLENFNPEMGWVTRRAYYHNPWLMTEGSNEWKPLSRVKVTNDDTGRRGTRVDFEGGTEGNRFYLKNCGFFGNGADRDRMLSIEPQGTGHQVDINALPKD